MKDTSLRGFPESVQKYFGNFMSDRVEDANNGHQTEKTIIFTITGFGSQFACSFSKTDKHF